MELVSPARSLVALLTAAVLLLVPAGAGAALQSVDVSTGVPVGALPPSGKDAAGAHPNFRVDMQFDQAGNPAADSVKTYDIHFAPGIVSYVNHVPKCTAEQFDLENHATAPSCPASSQVGEVDTYATVQLLVPTSVPLMNGAIYNLEPPEGSPAALAIHHPPPLPGLDHVKILVTVTIDPHDLALTATIHDLPNESSGMATHIDRIDQTLFGYVGGASFFTNPTSCIPAPVTVTATSHGGAVSEATDAYTPTDCENVPFDTILTVSADPPMSDATSTISFNVKPGQADVPRSNSHVRSATVVAPPGVLINPALAARLDACTDEQFAQSDTSVPAQCPPSSAVGDIAFVSPILGAFPGKAYFGTQTPTDRLRLFLNVPLYGANIKVSAHVNPSYETGQITTVFDELPQIAFTDFTLTFNGGPRSALVTPTTCGTNTATATVIPWSGGPPSTPSGSFETSWDGAGAPCQRPFEPSFATGLSSTQAGGTGIFELVFERPDRHVPVGRMSFRLPAGFVGDLALPGLVLCALPDAAAGACPQSSRIGSVQAVAGSGSEPPTLPGEVFLTRPKVPGDAAGLSFKVPAKLGPVDAGTVIVGTRLDLRDDGGLDVVSDAIPAFQLGIPLALRQLRVTIDRPGFHRHPTSCGTKTIPASFESIGGERKDATATMTFTGCDKLAFEPALRSTIVKRPVGRHPRFTTTITQKQGEASIRRARVVLPPQLAANLAVVQAACTPEQLAADACGEKAKIGEAVALSPILRDPLRGPVHLVQRGPGLPKLVVSLRGPADLTLEGFFKIGPKGRIAATFPSVPDSPISRFTLRFEGGRDGSLTVARNLCRKPVRLNAQFAGHDGKGAKQRPVAKVIGCKKKRR